MSRWSRNPDVTKRDIYRALVIAEYHDDEQAIDHIGRDW